MRYGATLCEESVTAARMPLPTGIESVGRTVNETRMIFVVRKNANVRIAPAGIAAVRNAPVTNAAILPRKRDREPIAPSSGDCFLSVVESVFPGT